MVLKIPKCMKSMVLKIFACRGLKLSERESLENAFHVIPLPGFEFESRDDVGV